MVLNVQSEIAGDVQRKPIEVISTGATLGAEVRGVDLRNIDASQFTTSLRSAAASAISTGLRYRRLAGALSRGCLKSTSFQT